jgi:carbon monoxide dehydrogenase subunit G
MITVEGSTTIQQPIARVFDYMNQPKNQVEITPSLSEVKNTERIENGGIRAGYTYKMAGMNFRGKVEAQEFYPKEKINFRMSGDIDGNIIWLFQDENGHTRFTYRAEYEIPNPLLEKLARRFVEYYNKG